MSGEPTPGGLYASVRRAITGLVRDLPEEAQRTPVPGCPGWAVRDVVAHATGLVADVNAGRLDGVTTDPWTDAQVQARRDTPLADVLVEWERECAAFEPYLDAAPKGVHRTVLIDLVTHEHDIRGALGVPGGRDGEPYAIARKGFAVAFAKKVAEHGLPGVRFEAPDWSFDAGEDPAVTVRVKDSHELFRALAGRRGTGQILAYDWDGDPAPYLPFLNHFGPLPDADVVERD